MVVDAARAELGIVHDLLRRAEPHIPVEAGLHRLFFQIVGLAGIAELAFDAIDLSDHAVQNQLAGDAELFTRALHRAGLKDALGRVHLFHERNGLMHVVGQRLLAVDVFARAQRRQTLDGVPVVGRGDADQVDVLAGDQLAKIVIGLTARSPFCRILRVEVVDLFLGGFAARGVHVADSEHLHVLVQEVAEQAAHLLAHADATEAGAVVRLDLGRPDVGGKNEGGAGNGCAFEEVSAVHFHVLCVLTWPRV